MADAQTITIPRAEKPLGMFFFFVVLIHLLDVFMGRMGLKVLPDVVLLVLFIVILPVIGWLGPFRGDNPRKNVYAFVYLIALGAISYVLPLIAYRFLANASPTLVMTILVFFPAYPFILYFTHYNELGKFWKNFMTVYLVIWILVTVYSNPTFFSTAAAETARYTGAELPTVDPGALIVSRGIKAWEGLKSLANATTTGPKQFLNQSIQQATGDAYTSRVDRNAKAKLGVVINDIQLTQPQFSQTDSVGFFTTLTAQTLDAPLRIRVNCTAKDSKNANIDPSKRATLTPDTSVAPIEVFEQETIDIDCSYQPGAVPAGRATLSLGADFGMETLAYLKTYFMDRERLRELRTAKIDPFQQYGITDRTPVTIYTNGPVNIGMAFGAPPIGVDTTLDEFSGTLGISIKNEWPGKVRSIDFVAVLVPRAFSLTELSGVDTQQLRCLDLQPIPDWCDDSISNLYIIRPGAVSIDTGKAVTIRARLRAPRSEYESLLGTSPISTKYFKAIAAYNYSIEKAISTDIKQVSAGSVTPTNLAVHLVGQPIVDVSAADANVSFVTDVSAPTEIRYCKGSSTAACPSSSIIVRSNPTPSQQHKFSLDNLQFNTLYAYELYGFSTACNNNRCKLNEFTFTTGAS